jgi:hypothetical protein
LGSRKNKSEEKLKQIKKKSRRRLLDFFFYDQWQPDTRAVFEERVDRGLNFEYKIIGFYL